MWCHHKASVTPDKFQVQRCLFFVYENVYEILQHVMSSLTLQHDRAASYGLMCLKSQKRWILMVLAGLKKPEE